MDLGRHDFAARGDRQTRKKAHRVVDFSGEPPGTTGFTLGNRCEVVGLGAPSPTSQQQDVLKGGQNWLIAFNSHDLDTFARYVDDDFLGTTDDGIFVENYAYRSVPSEAIDILLLH